MKNLLENKVVLITGSSRGIGEATARLAREYGARVVLHGKEDSKHLRQVAKSIDAPYVFCDVTDEDGVKRIVEGVIESEKKIDVLINCAGIINPGTFLETSKEEWTKIFEVNVLGTVNFCKAAIPHMQEADYGRIVNIASIRGHSGTSARAAYSMSKAAIINLTSVLAKEFAPVIAVNAVSPGFTKTDLVKNWTKEGWKRARTSLLGRVAEPKEIAEAVLFLASERASFITGQVITVDGGYSIAGK